MPCGAVTAKENNIIRIIVPIIASMIDSCMPYCSKAGSESILASQRLYRSIGIAILPDMVARHTGTNPFFTPAVLWIVDPPKSSLILKH